MTNKESDTESILHLPPKKSAKSNGRRHKITPQDEEDLQFYKLSRAEIATDLCYPTTVISKIMAAKSDFEVDAILRSAREGNYSKKKN